MYVLASKYPLLLIASLTVMLAACSATDLYQVDPITTHINAPEKECIDKGSTNTEDANNGSGKQNVVSKKSNALCYGTTYQTERKLHKFITDPKRVVQYSDVLVYFKENLRNVIGSESSTSGNSSVKENEGNANIGGAAVQAAADPTKIEDASKTVRNELVQELRSRSNEVCDLHKAAILAHNATFNVTLGGLTTLLAGTASVVGGFQAPIFAAGAAGTNSIRSLVNDEVYARSVAGLIVRAIEKGRTDSWHALSAKLNEPYNKYDVFEAISDVEEFHQTCSFYVGITRISEALENQKPSREDTQARKAALAEEEKAVLADIDKIKANITAEEAKPNGGNTAGDADLLRQAQQRLLQIRALKNQLLFELTNTLSMPPMIVTTTEKAPLTGK